MIEDVEVKEFGKNYSVSKTVLEVCEFACPPKMIPQFGDKDLASGVLEEGLNLVSAANNRRELFLQKVN